MGQIISKNDKINGLKFIELHNKRVSRVVKAVRIDRTEVMLTKTGKLVCNRIGSKTRILVGVGKDHLVEEILTALVTMDVIKQSDMDQHMANVVAQEEVRKLNRCIYELEQIEAKTGIKFTRQRQQIVKMKSTLAKPE